MTELKYRKGYVFDFESLVDTRSGCIRYILNSKTVDKSYFKPFMQHPTTTMLKNLYVSQQDPNPIKWLLKDEYIDSADDLYKELLLKHYRGILNNSLPTDVFRLMNLVNRVDIRDTDFTVNCANEEQLEVANSIAGHFKATLDNYDVSLFSCVYVSTIDILDRYNKNTEGKNVYIHNIRMNYDDNFTLDTTMEYYIGHVVIHTIDPYIGIPLYTANHKKKNKEEEEF